MKLYVVSDTGENIGNKMKERFKVGYQKAKRWVAENKETVVIAAPVVIGALTTFTKVVGRRVNLRKQESIKNLYCYDRSLGHYWSLRRELTNREWLAIDERKKNGERLADILSELRVLK